MEQPTTPTRPKFLTISLVANLILLLVFIVSFYVFQSSFNTQFQTYLKKYHERRKDHFETLPNDKDEIIFLGNSITDGGNWAEMFDNPAIKNRGISADKATDVLNRINEVCESKPRKIFLMIGTNDLGYGKTVEETFKVYEKILTEISIQSPATKLYLQSVLPVNPSKGEIKRKNTDIIELNKKIEAIATKFNATYIDLFTPLSESGVLNPAYTNDGLHLLGKGYLKWKTVLEKFVKE